MSIYKRKNDELLPDFLTRKASKPPGKLTLNQRVQGSSPCAPTNHINHLAGTEPDSLGPVGRLVGRLCSPFELGDGAFAEVRIAAEIVRIEDRAHAAQRVPGDGGDLGFGAPTSASRVTAVPRKSLNVTPTTPTALHALPHDARKPSEVHGLLSLLVRIIVLRFGEASSAALSGAPTFITTRAPLLPCLSLNSCRHRPTTAGGADRPVAGPVHSASNSGRCRCAGRPFRKRRFILRRPNTVAPASDPIKSAATLARIGGDQAAVIAPRQHARQYRPSILPWRRPAAYGRLVAPCHEDAAATAISQRR